MLNGFLYYRVAWFASLIVFLLLQSTRFITLFISSAAPDNIQIIPIIFYGLIIDLMTTAVFLLFFGFFNSLYSTKKITSSHAFFHSCQQVSAVLTLLLIFLITQFLFFSIYGTQINLHALVNLLDPMPILKNIWDLFPVVEILLGIVALGWAIYVFLKSFLEIENIIVPSPSQRLMGLSFISLFTFGSWLLLQSIAFESIPGGVQKELASNSFYSLTHIGKVGLDYSQDYASLDSDEVKKQLQLDYGLSHNFQGRKMLLKSIDNQEFALTSDKCGRLLKTA